MNQSLKTRLFHLAGLCLLLASFLIGFVWMYTNSVLERVVPIPETGILIEIKSGDTFNEISDKLYAADLGPSQFWSRLTAFRYPELTRLKVAEYQLQPGMTYGDILNLLTSGRGIDYTIRFIEGWTVKQALTEFAQHEAINKDIELDSASVRTLLNIKHENIEGWLFPDTYYYSKNGLLSELLITMYTRMQVSLAQAWNARTLDNILQTPYELLILASIIEKESALATERNVISGVFHRRLAKGMRLQTDPTVIYGIGESFDGNIRRKDLNQYTPYNTYQIKGLPPTPIALPSMESLMAAAQPADGTALYFVSKGDGSHVFSDTLEEHNRAVRKYQLRKN